MSRLRRYLPDWAVVMAISGAVGALSAIVAVRVYRDVATQRKAISVPSESNDYSD